MDAFVRMMLSAAVTLVISVPVILVLVRRGAYIRRDQKIIDQARASGRTSEGRLTSKRWSRPDPASKQRSERVGAWFSCYEYCVDGHVYHYNGHSVEEPPQRVTFYYPEGRPDKAIPEGSDKPGLKVLLLTLLPIVLWSILYNFVFV